MNIARGLVRISAVFWGFVGLFFGLIVFNSHSFEIVPFVASCGAALVLHLLTRWIVRGFFPD